MQINKMTPETLEWIATCANEAEDDSVRKLSCADVRGLLAEHAALVAVAEAAQKSISDLRSAEETIRQITSGDYTNDARHLRNQIKAFQAALTNLAAVREGGAK
jgi:hypothetical protein